jgi:protein-S-isoprenylcysteine O-methyltransferase
MTLAFLTALVIVALHVVAQTGIHATHRLGASDERRDPQYMRSAAVAGYAVIFGAQVWGVWRSYGSVHVVLPLAGAVIFAAGLALRLWSVWVLGRLFTYELAVREGHELVVRGPYRLLRHPSYTGYLMMQAGQGVACMSLITLLIPLVATALFLARRIPAEEAMLAGRFGEAWRAHRERTWRLIPLVW